MARIFRYFAADFETTVWPDDKIEKEGVWDSSGKKKHQASTEVWSAAICEFWQDNVTVYGNITDFIRFLFRQPQNLCVYFHNLKFDGHFIVYWLLKNGWKFKKDAYHLVHKQFSCNISEMGQWYTITLKHFNNVIEFRDSLKLLPFKLADVGKAFQTKHQKLDMSYVGDRYANCPISEEEMRYIKNDVLVLKEALEYMFSQGHTKLTIGACCLSEFKNIILHGEDLSKFKLLDKEDYNNTFPNLYDCKISKEEYNAETIGEYIHNSYRGGWCYLNPKFAGKVIVIGGEVYDVNSLYPSMMHSSSGNRYPVGFPRFFKSEIPEKVKNNPELIYFVRFRCRFKLRKNYLPFVQIKKNPFYKGTEHLTTSDFCLNGKYSRYGKFNGEIIEAKPTLTMTKMDFELFQKHYHIYDLEILDGCYFHTEIGMFDEYIEKWMKIKEVSTGAMRTIAKLFMNNLYGKLAASTDSSYKIPHVSDKDGAIHFTLNPDNSKTPGYIPAGSCVTSYSRCFTITAAQKNYERFIYGDTDSMHLLKGKVKGITVHKSHLSCWKNEASWDNAVFVRQKTYFEHVTHEDGEQVEPFNNIKCAGMSDECKTYFEDHYTMKDFKIGLELPNKLVMRRVPGGVILENSTMCIR